MIYVVQPGDTLWSIARQYGVTVAQIAALNQIPDPDVLVVGQALLILSRIKQGPLTIDVGGYAYPFISPWVLRETLPFLSQLAVFSYGFTPEGQLLPPVLADGWMVERAKAAGVRPALVLTPLGRDGQFSNLLVHALLQNAQAQVRLLQEIQARMALLGFGELNIDFEYVLPEDREGFAAFVKLAADTLEELVSVCLAPKNSRDQRGLLYEGKDYRLLGQAADRVLLMTYEWGYKYGPPMAVAPLEPVRRVVEYALTEIPAEKISLGLANYGYDWPLPFEQGVTVARTIGNVEAVEIAKREKTNIIFDWESKSPWFQYTDGRGVRHVVWFEDVRSWKYKLDLLREYGLTGVGIWQLMQLFRAGMNLIGDEFRSQPAEVT